MSAGTRTIADRLALQDVMARYARHVDERDFDLFRGLFDEKLQAEGFGPETLQGPDAWIDFVRTALSAFGRTQHMLGPVLAEIDGDHARARTDLQAIHVHLPPKTGLFTVWGTYHTEMSRSPGGWQIVRHRLDVSHVDGM